MLPYFGGLKCVSTDTAQGQCGLSSFWLPVLLAATRKTGPEQYNSAWFLRLLCLILVFLCMEGIGKGKNRCYLYDPQAAESKLAFCSLSCHFSLDLKMVLAALLCFNTVATPKHDHNDGFWSPSLWSSHWLSWRGRKYVNESIAVAVWWIKFQG